MKASLKHLFLIVGLMMTLTLSVSANFTDVEESDWFYSELELLVDSGIVSGYEDGTFRPYNTVTVGEVSKMLYLFWDYEALPNGTDHWADNYAAKVEALCWLDDLPDDLNQSATRIQVAEALLNSIGALSDPWASNPFSDVDSALANTLYDMGIMNGSVDATTGERTLSPDAPITRAELCALLNRTSLYMTQDYSVTDYRYLLPQAMEPDTPALTEEFFYDLIFFMMVHDYCEYTVVIPDTTIASIESSGAVMLAEEAFRAVQTQYHEFGAFFDQIGLSIATAETATVWKVTLSNSMFDQQTCINNRYNFLLNIGYWAQQVCDDYCVLDPTLSDYQKALYFYYYCANNFAYDTSYSALSYNGYGMLQNNVGVCQGYVSVYNALCKIYGIDIIGVSGQVDGWNHIWSYANLDGTWYYIDPTFGDPIPDREGYCDDSYFALTFEEISLTHTFD